MVRNILEGGGGAVDACVWVLDRLDGADCGGVGAVETVAAGFGRKKEKPWESGRLILGEGYNFVGCAVENGAELLQRVHRYGLIALQIGDCISADAVFINQGVGSNTTVFHRLPQRFVADHICTSPFCFYTYIIHRKMPLEY